MGRLTGDIEMASCEGGALVCVCLCDGELTYGGWELFLISIIVKIALMQVF